MPAMKIAMGVLACAATLLAGCVVVVVLTHVAEAFKLFPIMGWGLPTSPGHYLDLISAVLGCTLLPLGFLGNAIARWKNAN